MSGVDHGARARGGKGQGQDAVDRSPPDQQAYLSHQSPFPFSTKVLKRPKPELQSSGSRSPGWVLRDCRRSRGGWSRARDTTVEALENPVCDNA